MTRTPYAILVEAMDRIGRVDQHISDKATCVCCGQDLDACNDRDAFCEGAIARAALAAAREAPGLADGDDAHEWIWSRANVKDKAHIFSILKLVDAYLKARGA